MKRIKRSTDSPTSESFQKDVNAICDVISNLKRGKFDCRLKEVENEELGTLMAEVNALGHSLSQQELSSKKLQAQFEDQAAFLRRFFEFSSVGLNLCKLDGTWIESNPAFLRMLGYSEEEANGKLTYWGLTPRKYDEAEKVQLESLAREGRYGPYEKEFIRKDGTTVPVRLNGFIIERNGEKFIWSLIEDITTLVSKRQDLERVNKFLELVLQNVPLMIFVKDFKKDLSFSLLNRAGEELIGAKQEQLLGKNDYDLFPKEQADFFVQSDRDVFANRRPIRIDGEEIATPKGKRVLETFKVPTFDAEGAPDYLVGISQDITDEVNARRELELERAKSLHSAKLASLGELAAGIAHEINNPLAVISGSILLLNKFKDDPEKFEAKIQALARATDRIEKIVKGLRKFSRDYEGTEFKSERIDQIVNEAVVLAEAKAKRHGTSIEVNLNSNAHILCDSVEIEQVLVNLINNAVDAVKDLKNRWIKIEMFNTDKKVVIQVIDSGNGVAPEIEEKLFHPFFTTKPVGEGTGLGLSIVKGILDTHHGAIRLNRAVANTCFEIELPREATNVTN